MRCVVRRKRINTIFLKKRENPILWLGSELMLEPKKHAFEGTCGASPAGGRTGHGDGDGDGGVIDGRRGIRRDAAEGAAATVTRLSTTPTPSSAAVLASRGNPPPRPTGIRKTNRGINSIPKPDGYIFVFSFS